MKTYLEVPFEDRLIVKTLGARWDPANKLWYCPDGTDLAPLVRWVPAKKLATKATPKQQRKIERVLNGNNNKQTQAINTEEGLKPTPRKGAFVKLK